MNNVVLIDNGRYAVGSRWGEGGGSEGSGD